MRILIFICLLAVGCSQTPSSDASWFQKSEKLKVLTTVAMINDLVQEVGGEHVHTISLICGELDPHTYELVKGDDEKFARADLIFYNGLGLEHGLSLRKNLEKNPKAVAVADSILERNPSAILRVDGTCDPHIWMDISLWMEVVEPIVATLCEHDPEHAVEYRERAHVLLAKMRSADEAAFERLQAIAPEKRYLITSHDAFNYFARRYLADPGEEEWMSRCEAPEGLAPEAQMSVGDVLEILAHLQRYQVTVLFPESNMSRDALKKILRAASEKGMSVRLCSDPLYGDSMGAAASYLDMLSHNVDVIAGELAR
ncbi:MAG: Manganese-binding lipoprotein MntA [Chlamydiales bacterium]|nr:Manganese-binding lipoprotein MntA [Chlamydiales bacterium]